MITRHNDSINRKDSLQRCVPDMFIRKNILYVGAHKERMDFGSEFQSAKAQITILEAWPKNVEFLKKLGYKVTHGDVRKCDKLFASNTFDAVFWWHGPEHVTKEELPATLKAIEKITKHLVVCGCPWGDYPQGEVYGNPFEVHQSALEPELFTKVGYNTETLGSRGVGSNMNAPYTFLADNLKMNMNIVEVISDLKIRKFLAIGSVCMYPKYAKIPFVEEDIWAGYPEETNSPYGVSKRILLELCHIWKYKMIIPTNLYGPGADADLKTSHVIPALIRKCLHAKKTQTPLSVWGTGKATRDFLYVEDAARAIVQAVACYDNLPSEVNIASGIEVSIASIIELIVDIVGFEGEVLYDASKPDGQPRRRVSIEKALTHLKWTPNTNLRHGLIQTIKYYQKQEF